MQLNRIWQGFLNVVMVVAVACAVVLTARAVRGSGGAAASRSNPRTLDADLVARLMTTGHRIGPASARLTVIEFGDFQCPVCGAFESVLDSMRSRHPDAFSVVFHQFPLSYHQLAYPLARASECAADQGRFVAFHDSVYAAQKLLGVLPVTVFGERAGIADLDRFRRCIANTGPVAAIDSDLAIGRRIPIAGTPAVIIGRELLPDHPTLRGLEEMLAERR